jgi:hypothetical protein
MLVAAFTRVPTRTVGGQGMENNAMQLTRPVPSAASQLIASVRRTCGSAAEPTAKPESGRPRMERSP